jgi:hypothetical protein
VALRDDPVSRLLDQIRATGWTGNVAIPVLNGFVILAVKLDAVMETEAEGQNCRDRVKLRTDCTVGVFLERLKVDLGARPGAVCYGFELEGPGRYFERGRAELVGLGG